IDPDSYQQYLRAKALYGARGYNQLVEASSLLQQVVARNPDYAPAWALLGLTDTRIPVFHPGYFSGQLDLAKPVISTYLPSGEAAANKAIQLDPKLADSYVVLGFVQMAHGHYLGAVDYASKALALDPNNADAL